MKAAAATDIARDGEDVGGPHIASARRASGCEDHRTNNAEPCDVSPLCGPLAPSAYFFRQANPTRTRNPANSVLIQSTFVRVCCPTATTLIEMKQLCGVAKARRFGIAATMSCRLDVAAIMISAFDSRACEMSQPYCF